ncbi:MAG TPA: DUF4406 domain-containing protein [Candidatus Nanoarchaeia archaeon]|nr:DUF4406 domain-containing protein [Candidatus Nanoarchaeia archaeon]
MAKKVFIAHPIAGNIEENCRLVEEICREVHTREVLPFVPYLASLRYLDDTIPEQRELGICVNKATLEFADELWLCGPRISSGMKQEVEWAVQLGKTIKCYNPELQNELERIVEQFRTNQPIK